MGTRAGTAAYSQPPSHRVRERHSRPCSSSSTEQLDALEQQAAVDTADAVDAQALEQLRVGLLGKKGKLSGVLGAMGKLPWFRSAGGRPEGQCAQDPGAGNPAGRLAFRR